MFISGVHRHSCVEFRPIILSKLTSNIFRILNPTIQKNLLEQVRYIGLG
jgi:hypothetical protein